MSLHEASEFRLDSDLDADTATNVANDPESAGGKAIGMACDVTDDAQLEALVEPATDTYGKLTTVVSNAGGGAILATTSMAGDDTSERMAAYGASKVAANHLIRSIAFDLGPVGIRANGVVPGATRTDALESVLTDEIEAKILSHTPIHRLGEPRDSANAALYLCSPAASWISGQILTVSGGGVQELS